MCKRQQTTDPVVIVVGAGAAGVAAAIAAAQGGSSVLLVERTQRLGGTVTSALLHTLGGFFDSHGSILNGGLPALLVERLLAAQREARIRRIGRAWTVAVSPEVYEEVVARWLSEQPGIRLLTNASVSEVTVRDSAAVSVAIDHGGTRSLWTTHSIVDATGSAEIVRMIDRQLVIDDIDPAASGLVTRLRNVAPHAVTFPQGIQYRRAIERAVNSGHLPAACAHAWLDEGLFPDEVYVKQFVPMPSRTMDIQYVEGRRLQGQHNMDNESLEGRHVQGQHNEDQRGDEHVLGRALEEQRALVAFLQTLPAFERAEVDRVGGLGVRSGRRIVGEFTLGVDDVRRGRTFADAACRASWPIEHWHGHSGVEIEYLDDERYYEIPLRSLKVRRLTNVWSAGRCLSADPLAQSSARVVGLCWAMGEAAGIAASFPVPPVVARP